MLRYIEKLPPEPTGNPKKDTDSLYQYLFYLREQLNSIIAMINKGEENGKQ